MGRFLRYALAALVVAAAVGAATVYVLKPPPAKTAQKGLGHGHVHGHGPGDKHAHDEGVTMTDAQTSSAGIELLKAGPAELRDILLLNGIIQPNQEALVKVGPRFPGVVRSLRKRLGDRVAAGEVLATIESNQSLTTVELKAPIDGTVIDRDGTLGEFASEQRALFTIADLSTMWVDFAVFRRDFSRVRLGDTVSIDVEDGGPPIAAKIDYVSPLGASDTQSAVARAIVRNDGSGGGRLRAGLYVSGRVLLSARPVDIAVRTSALQTHEGRTVVYVRDGQKFEPREVELGSRDAEQVEIRFGLMPGDLYAAKNSFVVKAEAGKAGASHEH